MVLETWFKENWQKIIKNDLKMEVVYEDETSSFLENENFQSYVYTTFSSIFPNNPNNFSNRLSKMFPTEFIGNTLLDMVNPNGEDRGETFEAGFKTNGETLVMNTSSNITESTIVPELFYRHSAALTVVYCVAYILVFAVGLVGNCFVIAVVFRSPRMRTVTNFFIVNLAIADILVIVFCLPATLTSNIFVRKYIFF